MRTKPLIFLLASLSSLNTHKVQNLQNISVGISDTQIFLISLYVWFLNHFSVSISLSNTAPTLDSLLPSSSSQSTPTSFSLSLSLSLSLARSVLSLTPNRLWITFQTFLKGFFSSTTFTVSLCSNI